MKKTTKTAVLLLALVLSLSVFTACTDDEKPGGGGKTEENTKFDIRDIFEWDEF